MHIVMQRALDPDVVGGLYESYVQAFGELVVQAAARHVLTLDEFAEEMADERIEKHLVVSEDDGRILGLTTLTKDLTTVPWINEHYYRNRYPDAAAQGAMFYIGYTFVHRSGRRQRVLWIMAREMDRLVGEVDGVVGFDMCAYNNYRGIGRRKDFLFPSSTRVDSLDTQSYYTADYRKLDLMADQTGPEDDSYRTVTLAERPELIEQIGKLLPTRWPLFMLAGHPGHDVDLSALLDRARRHQVLLLDEQDNVCGAGLSVPLRWNGTAEGLPQGWDDVVTQSAALLDQGLEADTACALSVTIAPNLKGKGFGARLISALSAAAYDANLGAMIVSVRPTQKSRYPLVSMEEYLTWRADGEPFDPWLRLHLWLGAKVLRISPASMTITGRVDEWEDWLDLKLPNSGQFVIPGGLVPLTVDVEADLGTYVEPNVWVRHEPRPL